jgi:DNA-binding response OmpR family regulator
MRILVIENDAALGSFICGLVEEWGYRVRHFDRATDALHHIENNSYDLAIMEVLLPDIRGEELISRIKTVLPYCMIVTLAGNNSREMESRIREKGVLYYMIKPVEIENLKTLLEYTSKRITNIKDEHLKIPL